MNNNKIISITIIVTFVLIVVSIAFYAGNFCGILSTDPAIWGQFGDYIGGTINPIVALSNVIITVVIALAVQKISSQQIEQDTILQNLQIKSQKDSVRQNIQFEIYREFSKEFNEHYLKIVSNAKKGVFELAYETAGQLELLILNFESSHLVFFSKNLDITKEMVELTHLLKTWESNLEWKESNNIEIFTSLKESIISKIALDIINYDSNEE